MQHLKFSKVGAFDKEGLPLTPDKGHGGTAALPQGGGQQYVLAALDRHLHLQHTGQLYSSTQDS